MKRARGDSLTNRHPDDLETVARIDILPDGRGKDNGGKSACQRVDRQWE